MDTTDNFIFYDTKKYRWTKIKKLCGTLFN
ncbi:MAG: hypothetical protein UX91_C0006G0071 [Candidatus Amesbacteria bacterium GW2011_GWB1_47_19]|nr:MAG: hypothetical protein UW51_C0002G0072 [Candidatus Amesbacteria bacterium GW2011_GWA1_44_24]KKU31338.1 MAG: hypothetical protein UX46_C0006G0130 [Candidatus Amesbacteria bacterium GW2011_GWC1_46_24]KKU67009.1 MAG: hypothetical protein UX91_C0006G0071 [Candidatus Amesbacteria bacterium GW2011_GWB1_47_19]